MRTVTLVCHHLSVGIDVEGLNRHRMTPLAAQVRADHADMAKELIRAGAEG